MADRKKTIAFIVGVFPAISETWLLNQVADLQDRDIAVKVFSLHRGDPSFVSDVYAGHRMADITKYLDMPEGIFLRLRQAIPKALRMLRYQPVALLRALNIFKYGRQALSLQLIFWSEPFLGMSFDLYHCHFGTVANRFLAIKYVLGLHEPMMTSFYGQDVSRIFQAKGDHYYDALRRECQLFIVMSEYMKSRIVAKGFDPDSIRVIPIFGIDVASYPFVERTIAPDQTIQISTVGRFVEKKGFDDLLRALAIVKEKTTKKFMCNIIGGGEMEQELQSLTDTLGIRDVVSFKGYMKLEEIIRYFLSMHLYIQPSKTAANGDQE